MLHELGLSPILFLQEVPAWTFDTNFPGYEVHTELGSDTAVCMPSELATQVRDIRIKDSYSRVLANDFVFGSVHLPDSSKGLDALEQVLDLITADLLELKTRWPVREIVIGADLNVTLAANIDGYTGDWVHGKPHATREWDNLVMERLQLHGLRALN
eukprot:5681595-Karenia_brevis.AAC.1